jgi:hypothetical protein
MPMAPANLVRTAVARPADPSLAWQAGWRHRDPRQIARPPGAIGAGPFTPALDGTEFGLDFNPQVDRLRVVSNAGQNLRLNPDTDTVAATDTRLQYASTDRNAGRTPNVVGAAYTNNFAGTTATVVNDIDSGRARDRGEIGDDELVRDIAIAPTD